MKIEAEKKSMFKFSASNSCSCMGCYYPEDDWDIIEYASTLEELKERSAIRIIDSDIYIDYWYISIAEMLYYEQYEFELSTTDIKKEHPNFLNDILSSDTYKSKKSEKEEKIKLEKEKTKKKEVKEMLDAEKKQYEKLKKKFEEEK